MSMKTVYIDIWKSTKGGYTRTNCSRVRLRHAFGILNNYEGTLIFYVETRMRLLIPILLSVLLSGCWIMHSTKESLYDKKEATIIDTLQRTVALKKVTSLPCDQDCTTTHLGYWRAQEENLIWSVKHLIPEQLESLRIEGYGSFCPIKQIRLHKTQDLVLIETTTPCLPWIAHWTLNDWKQEQGYLQIDQVQKTLSLSYFEWMMFASWLTLHPGMSGSPLVTKNGALVWLVHAQTPFWTTFTTITPWWTKELLWFFQK